MRNIEQKISPLIKSMFPSFYLEEGPNFVAFMEAYYEWLEQNFQLIELEDNTGFEVGNTIQQEEVTGKIIAFVDESLLVLVDELQTFKCLNVCSELLPVTTYNPTDGKVYSTYIKKGGTTRRLGTLFFSRNLMNMRDIDTTLDLFVVKFKEKYLKNIEFDIATNKKLLVKNSMDLYRSKGTSRSIDLFFRLIYGLQTEVYYPGDDLFRLSDAEWYVPNYIEINSTSVERAISLVGKQITGVTSGASAFVERYVKKKTNNTFIHVFYVSNVQGEFTLNELLKSDQLYSDSPFVLGSLGTTTVITKSSEFKVGDIVSLSSGTGDNALARVTSTSRTSGEIEYSMVQSGFGYSKNSGVHFDPPLDSQATQTYTSDNIIKLENVNPGKVIDTIFVNDGGEGSGYSNDDIIVIQSQYENATARPITDASGSIVDVVLTGRGSGFFPDVSPVEIVINDSTGVSPSLGIDGSVNVTYRYPDKYYFYLDTVKQNIYNLQYSSATYEDQLEVGSYVQVGPSSYGIITKKLPNESGTGDMTIVLLDKGVINNYDEIVVVANTMVRAIAYLPVSNPATGRIIYTSNTATLTLGIPTGTIAPGNFIYQVNEDGTLLASGTVKKTSALELDGGAIDIENLYGIFELGTSAYVQGTGASAPILGVSFDIAVVDRTGNFIDLYGAPLYSNSGFSANVLYVSSGANASFSVGTLTNAEDVKLNIDRLDDPDFMNTKLSALAYNFPANPSANSESIIYGALEFINFTIGSISTLAEINPGTGYNQDPVTSVYQPFITGYQRKDYIFDIENVNGSFVVGENVTQTKVIPRTGFLLDNTDLFKFGEKVYLANTTHDFVANGVITYLDTPTNYMILKGIEGTVPPQSVVNTYIIKSMISVANAEIIANTISTNETILVKAEIDSIQENKIYANRIQFENYFDTTKPITGSLTGATADIVDIYENESTNPIGFNAVVNAEALYANGTVTGLQITDSGFGYIDGEIITYSSSDNTRSGTAYGRNVGVGKGSGFYKNSKGFVSDLSKIHDGDYYQEYSYDIISKFPLDKYADMFKKVMHTAGTRVFGSVLIDSDLETRISIASVFATGNNQIVDSGSVTVSNTSPYVIQDRATNDVLDRATIEIEIRD